MKPPEQAEFPNLLILGAQKAATTSLHKWLSDQPSIRSTAELKDTDLFVWLNREGKMESFLNSLSYSNKKATYLLHSCVNYMFYEEAMIAIREHCPSDSKFIVVLRSPTARAHSAFKYFRLRGTERRDQKEALRYTPQREWTYSLENNDMTYIEHGFYATQLDMLHKYVKREDLLLLDYDRLTKEEGYLQTQMGTFLDIECTDEGLSSTNSTQQAPSGLLTFIIRIMQSPLIQPIKQRFGAVAKKAIMDGLIEHFPIKGKAQKEELHPELKEFLTEQFKEEVAALTERHGLDFVREWPEYQALQKTN